MLEDVPDDDLFPIRTPRLSLRLPVAGDLPAVLDYLADPRVARHLTHERLTGATGRQALSEWIARVGLDSPARALAVVVEHEGRVIGDVVLWTTDETGAKGEIGWAFHPDVAGRGFATEAAAAVLEIGFARHGMHRIEARMDPRNTASARVAERLGMGREALHRRDFWCKGGWTDTLVHAALGGDAPRDVGDAIVVSAVTLRDAEGRILTVRKRGTRVFIQPGGKPEAGEGPAACALREVGEELGLELAPAALDLVAVHRTAAANEAGRPLIATLFSHPHLSGASAPRVVPAAEIEEVRWLDPRLGVPEDTAPLLRLVATGGLPLPRAEHRSRPARGSV